MDPAVSMDSDEHRLLRPGHNNCGGCGMSIGLNMLGTAVGHRDVQMVVPVCCAIVTAGPFPYSAYGVPVIAATMASGAAVATGVQHIVRMNREKTKIICWAGDGGTYDIGMATLSGAAERNEDILYICYDNEIYGNTGGQRSSSTPLGAATTTTPAGKLVEKKNILEIMIAHRIPYVASVSLAHPEDAIRKMKKALDLKGFRFLHLFAPCPTGWKSEPAQGMELIRLAVASGLYPVYEHDSEQGLSINVEPTMSIDALRRYFQLQGRFARAQLDYDRMHATIEENWKDLRRRSTTNP